MHHRLASMLLASGVLWLGVGLAPVLADDQLPVVVVTKGVSVSHDGPFTTSTIVASGSVVWFKVTVRNDGTTDASGIALADTATSGSLPPGCAGIPSPLPPSAAYTCLYRISVAPGVLANIATASFAGRSSSAIAVVTGTGAGIVTAQPAGLASSGNEGRLGASAAPATFEPTTTTAAVGTPVTWRAELGSGFAGFTVGVYLSEKAGDGSWSPFTRVTSRTVAPDGTVLFTRSEAQPRWVSVRFAFDATTTNAVQAHWQ